MVRPLPIFKILPSLYSGISEAHFRFDRDLQDEIKVFPGVLYAKKTLGKKCWQVPDELIGAVMVTAKEHGYKPTLVERDSAATLYKDIDKRLHEYQHEAALRLLSLGSSLLAFDPGLGKTLTTLAAYHAAGVRRILIVCPAIARQVWLDEIKKWGLPYFGVSVETGAHAKAIGTDLTLKRKRALAIVTSYELAKHIKPAALRITAVVCDESQFLRNTTSQRYKAVRRFVDECEPEYLTLLSGTPIVKEAADIHAQIDLMYPNRLGPRWKFLKRYAIATQNDYAESGFSFRGLNDEHKRELKNRLDAYVIRVTTDQVKHLLPPLTTQIIRVKSKRTSKADLLDIFEQHRVHTEKYNVGLLRDVGGRIRAAIEWAAVASTESPHCVIFTYYKDTARELAGKLGAYLITGDETQKKRHATIAKAAKAASGITVASVMSVGVAVDMTYATRVLFAELHWSPGVMEQALRRCFRLTSKSHVHVDMLAMSWTQDDVTVRTLEERFEGMQALLASDAASKKMGAAFKPPVEDEKVWAARMREIAVAALKEEDPYA